MRPDGVIVLFPGGQGFVCTTKGHEQRLVEEFVSQQCIDGEDAPLPGAGDMLADTPAGRLGAIHD